VILLTARDEKGDIVEGLGAGANDFVIKPFDPGELKARLAVGQRVITLQASLNDRIRELSAALEHVKTLQGIIPICMHCHKIRNDSESWQRIDRYIEEHSSAMFSHGLCPDCLAKHYPE
jgi:DNA-binding response OmpR family regulator